MLPNPLLGTTNATEGMFKGIQGYLLELGGAQVEDSAADVILLSAIKNLGEHLLKTGCPSQWGLRRNGLQIT